MPAINTNPGKKRSIRYRMLALVDDIAEVTDRTQIPQLVSNRWLTNPSVVKMSDGYVCVVKEVNFDRNAIMLSGDWRAENLNEKVSCNNHVLRLDESLRVVDQNRLSFSQPDLPPKWQLDIEDLRVCRASDRLFLCGAAVFHRSIWTGAAWYRTNQKTRVCTGELTGTSISNLKVMPPIEALHTEKNWIPYAVDRETVLLLTDVESGSVVKTPTSSLNTDGQIPTQRWSGKWSGSSPAIKVSGTIIGLIHRRTSDIPETYIHAFAQFDDELNLVGCSEPFSLHGAHIEFVCGITESHSKNKLLVSYGAADATAWIAELRTESVLAAINRQNLDAIEAMCTKSISEYQRQGLLDVIKAQNAAYWRIRNEYVKLADQCSQTLPPIAPG